MAQVLTNVRIPNVNVVKAIKYYYSTYEMSKDEVNDMFDGKVGSTVWRKLRDAAKLVTIEQGKPVFDARRLNTRCAFEAWGLDIGELEARYKKLERHKMI